MWKRIDNDKPARLPVKLVGEPPDTYWVDQDGAKVATNNPADYPEAVDPGGLPTGTVPSGEATIQDVFNAVKKMLDHFGID